MVKELTLNKVVAAFVGAAIVVSLASALAVSRAHAVTLAELVELFIALEVIPADKADEARTVLSSQDTETPPMDSVSCNFTRNLAVGDTGMDVKDLQKLLNGKGFTVATSGAGSPGMESEYYGQMTAAAVAKMQEAFASEILAPLGLSAGTGMFGSATRAKVNMLCASAPVVPEVPEEEGEEGEESSSDLGGEGVLDKFEIDEPSDDNLMEGDEDEVVAELTLEAKDGDIMLDRMSLTLEDGGVNPVNEELDPWDVFEEVSVWVDGEKVASFDASDEDEYLDEDLGEFRFSNLDLVLLEDEEVEVLVAVTVMGSVDGSDVVNGADWELSFTDVRYYDADDVATDENLVDELPGSVTFDIEEEGIDDGAEVTANSTNPDESLIKVDDQTDTTDELTVFVFDIEVDEDSSDLTLDDAFVDITVSNPVGGVDTTVGDVIDEVFLDIDGEKVEGEAVDDGDNDDTENTEIDHVIAATESNVVTYRFEFDGYELEGDTDYAAKLMVVFKGQDTNVYSDGVTVEADVDGADWEVEGLATDSELTGTEGSELHTLQAIVPDVTSVSDTVTADDPNDSGTISFKFTVGADDDDVLLAVASNTAVNGGTDDIRFTKSGPDTNIAVASLTKISGDATYAAGNWTILDGDEARFALDVTFTTVNTGDNGTYYVTLDTVGGVEVDVTSDGLALSTSVAP